MMDGFICHPRKFNITVETAIAYTVIFACFFFVQYMFSEQAVVICVR